ncbi:MAG: MGMT family protein [Candidatus Parcubacteria bacterium]|nr:MGMT family protein [Candidatus Parcubacteria bacterium]
MAKAKGRVTTYKILALKLGSASLARPVGNALHKNPDLINTPCHRVVKSNGSIGNYQLGLAKKIKLLQNEGIKIKAGKIENFTDVLYNFN